MQRIAHRINTLKQLRETSCEFGVEVDVRSWGNELVIHHDPFVRGEYFERWLDVYAHRTLILNVKEEGLESSLINLMLQRGIDDFFFLDQSFPFLRKTAIAGETRCAVRLSEYENIKTVESLSGMVDWVWVDCFTRLPLSADQAVLLKDHGFNLCFVSPELQGRMDQQDVVNYRDEVERLGIEGDAVCTKYPDLWE